MCVCVQYMYIYSHWILAMTTWLTATARCHSDEYCVCVFMWNCHCKWSSLQLVWKLGALTIWIFYNIRSRSYEHEYKYSVLFILANSLLLDSCIISLFIAHLFKRFIAHSKRVLFVSGTIGFCKREKILKQKQTAKYYLYLCVMRAYWISG